ncbi:MAG: class I SAM-dependent methyltransferase [Dehalococcoidia bacterium]|nr:class I SAM-dependent methyltransferase [Dehalococcoidia bacterium]
MPKSAFDDHPEVYDRARPGYPPALFDDLFAYIGGRPREAIEVGPGTGQATAALLARGMHVLAVEVGANMAAFLARKFGAQPRLGVVHAAFETAPLALGRADLVLAATAWHWVDAAVRMQRAHALLAPPSPRRAGGVLAVIDTNQVRSETDRGFFERCFPIYLRYRPDEQHDDGLPPDLVPPVFEEMRASGLFTDVQLWRYPWDQRYDGAQYADLVQSYSDTQSMEPAARAGLVADLRAMVEAEPDGMVTRPLVITLVAGRRT